MPVRLNLYPGEIESFDNRLTSQIKKLTVSLFNILVSFPKMFQFILHQMVSTLLRF